MTKAGPDTDELLDRSAAGDRSARGELLNRHRKKLKRMVVVRMDRRLAARLDPSDVVQEGLADAAQQLDEYLRTRPMPFYAWLRRLTWVRLLKLRRRHLAGKRTVAREEPPELPDESVLELANRVLAADTGPPDAAVRAELRQRVRTALERMAEMDREVLVLRFLEQLSTAETAAVLEVSDGAVKVRLFRALQRLRAELGHEGTPEDPS